MRFLLIIFGVVASAGAQPNVLLICVDDLRPELGCYGSCAVTPNLDAFASTARRFNRHYVTVPTCGASRASMMTGLLPTAPAHLGNGAVVTRAGSPTLPGVFKEAGYVTATLGKVTHWPADPPGSLDELEGDWSRIIRFDSEPWGDNKDAFFAYADGAVRVRGESPIAESPEVDDHAYPDARIADAAVDALADLCGGDEPFLLAVGFFKPHLPFNAPKRYRDLYDRDTIPDAPHPEPRDERAWRQSGEVTGNYGHDMWADRQWDGAERAFMRHAYLACVSYVDAQIGRVLDVLDKQGLADETIVIVWGDHGWHLGDVGLMGKHTVYDEALRSALLIRTPGMASPGEATDALVSTVDILPTLADLCAVDAPETDGLTIRALLDDPNAAHRDQVKSWWRAGDLIGESVLSTTGRTVTWRRGFGAEVVAIESLPCCSQ